MSIANRQIFFFFFLLLCQFSIAQEAPREFRGVWVATVNNIDWPSKPGLPETQQKIELLEILNTLEELHFNAVIFQVRPAGDAFYQSETEPWSHWLSGKQGEAPEQGWDPLKFMINECHKRGMELHAWLNPFRLSQNMVTEFSPKSVARRHPEWVLNYGNKMYLDPGIPAVHKYLNDVVRELLKKYDIDAIHFDDYFYPYPIAGEEFPDDKSFEMYNWGIPSDKKDQWRRENVDLIIEGLSKTIKAVKPSVKFGISPFGVWKNFDDNDEIKGSATTAGNTNYDNLYADVIKWQQKGWIDYMIPQLYWEIGHPAVDFITLANWWSERSFGRHVYVGHALYKLLEGKSAAWRNEQELPEQLLITRRMPDLQGSAFFRMQYLNRNPLNIKQRLTHDIYKERALLPTMNWIDNIAPTPPDKFKARGLFKSKKIVMKYKKRSKSNDHLGYLVYTGAKNFRFFPDDEIPTNLLGLSRGKHNVRISTIDKHHNERFFAEPLKIKIR